MTSTLRAELEARIAKALEAAGAPDAPGVVQPAARPEFGDYQANGVMGAAKRLKLRPRDLAQKVLEVAELDDLVAKAEIAGPGFINLTLAEQTLAAHVRAVSRALGERDAADDGPFLCREVLVGRRLEGPAGLVG